jgi:hypothetical protein
MWILPKQIQSLTSVSVLDTKESEKDLEEFCQMSEKSLMWRSKPSLLRTWLTRWKRNNWMQHLSIRTLKSSHTESFVEKWTSYLEDSLANHSLKLELEKLQRTQDTSSLTSQKESESANQELFSSKMSKESSQQKPQMENQFSDMSSEHWKDWVTKQRLEYSQRVKSASHIREKEFTSLAYPTPSVAGCVEGGVAKNVEMNEKGFSATRENGTKYGAKLRDAVIHQASKQWLTPTGVDIERTPEGMEKRKKYRESIGRKYVEGCLTEQVKNWGTPKEQDSRAAMTDRGKHNLGEQVHGMHNRNYPTPTSRDWKGAYSKESQESKPRNLLPDAVGENTQRDLMKNNTNGKPLVSLKLNPDWVEQLMGLPIGWTDFDFSEME